MNVLIEHNSGLARPSVCLSVFFVRLSRLGSSLENKNAHKKNKKWRCVNVSQTAPHGANMFCRTQSHAVNFCMRDDSSF